MLIISNHVIRTFLCIHSFILIKEVMEQANAIKTMEMVGVSTTLPSDSSVFYGLDIDVLVLDCSKDSDVSFTLGELIFQDPNLHMHIIYLVHEVSSDFVHHFLGNERSQYLVEPYSVKQILFKITNEEHDYAKIALIDEGNASQIMQSLGLPVHLHGFTYIKTAVELLYDSPAGIHLTMKKLYKEVARINSTTISRVEKSIRTSIDYAYRVSPSFISVQGKKPTNSQIIHFVYERLIVRDLNKKEEEPV